MRNLKKRVIIIEHDEKLRNLISSLIEFSNKYYLVQAYSSCHEALERIEKDCPDIVVLSLDYWGRLGVDFIVSAKKKVPADILVLSNYTDSEIVFLVLSAGAKGYVLLGNFLDTLIRDLDNLSRGGSPLDPLIARKLVEEMHVSRISPISERETEVLRLMIQGDTYIKIAGSLNISTETAKTHIKNIYRKLKVNSRSEAVRKALEDRLVARSSLSHRNNN